MDIREETGGNHAGGIWSTYEIDRTKASTVALGRGCRGGFHRPSSDHRGCDHKQEDAELGYRRKHDDCGGSLDVNQCGSNYYHDDGTTGNYDDAATHYDDGSDSAAYVTTGNDHDCSSGRECSGWLSSDVR